MASTSVYFFTLIVIEIVTQPSTGFCKGQCVGIEDCSLATHLKVEKSDCEDSTICCPVFQQIVTPKLKHQKKCLQYYSVYSNLYRRRRLFNRRNHHPKFFESIVRGENATPKEFPHMAALGFGDDDNLQWKCGGSLISKKFVLTAAHCVSNFEIGNVKRVRLGSISLFNTTKSSHVQEFNVEKVLRHPHYTHPILYNDIALIQLEAPIVITEYVRPACLVNDYSLEDLELIVTGWGNTQYLGKQSTTLLKASLHVFTTASCKQAYMFVPARQLPNNIMEDLQICAGDENGGRDSCQGDSGGPLQVLDPYYPNMYHIIGITSFGRVCGTTNNPGVYTRVSNYITWIEEIIWPSEDEI